MSSLIYKGRLYGGTSTVSDARHVLVDNGSGTSVTTQQMLTNILGDMATVESSVASKAYSIGDYIVLDSYFYKVTAAIVQGDTFVEGTNIEKTNVGAEVSALNSKTEKMVECKQGLGLYWDSAALHAYINGVHVGYIQVH